MTQIPAVLSIFATVACSAATSTHITQVVGTWGGENAGLIVSNTDVHVDAYPIDRGSTIGPGVTHT